MSGVFKGVQARISSLNEKALYFHCASHHLNLSIDKSSEVPMVKNMLATIASLAAFFNFGLKRQKKLEEFIEPLTMNLQKKAKDIVRAYKDLDDLQKPSVGSVHTATMSFRHDLDNIHLVVDAEFIRWVAKWVQESKRNPVLTSLTEAINKYEVVSFPNLHKPLRLILTLPITTAECERCMSRLRTFNKVSMYGLRLEQSGSMV
ncbi:52 kda repressor of the inhibitor of the protein kinase [Plakobranchus ocellatus]|uniref:52 kDa repressor of the inhibitor of the protein kinase n=1 Tax=Plakobranchus ocellatus TaxID=259542 RepID=A0AAV3ZSH0_9GAST|nr:52 kda repressor of the inhibitor of the protein kinase [Plakobranchus ocellatus]